MAGLAEEVPEPWETSFEGTAVVIGLGNRYMGDDGAGLVVADELRKRKPRNTIVYEYTTLDLALLWQFRNASKILILDALRTGEDPGTIRRYVIAPSREPLTRLPSLHAVQLYDIFDLAAQSGIGLCPVTIMGIEPGKIEPGEGLTAEVAAALPKLTQVVVEELEAKDDG